MGYTKDTIKGMSWMGGFKLANRAIIIAKTAIIARILSPSQFGIFGISALILSLIEILTETGINIFLIQEKEEVDKYIDTAWIVSILRGILIALIIVFSAPFIAGFFNSAESQSLIVLIAFVPFIRGFINPSEIKFQKNLQFHREFYFRFSLLVIESAVSTFLVLITRNAASLVYGMIASAIFEVGLSFMFINPRPKINLKKEHVKMIIGRGRWVTMASIFNYLFHNADNIVVGKLLNITSLGFYQMAYRISLVPLTEVADIFSKVTFPVYSKISFDKKRLRIAYFKTLLGISILVVPIGLVFLFFPEEIVNIILGPKWISISPILRILAVFGVIRALSDSVYMLFYALKKQKTVTFLTFINFIILMILIIPLVYKFGITGAALSVLIASIASIPFIIYSLMKVFIPLK